MDFGDYFVRVDSRRLLACIVEYRDDIFVINKKAMMELLGLGTRGAEASPPQEAVMPREAATPEASKTLLKEIPTNTVRLRRRWWRERAPAAIPLAKGDQAPTRKRTAPLALPAPKRPLQRTGRRKDSQWCQKKKISAASRRYSEYFVLY
ncbi:unnamed protein product [Cylicocyclus nassatus]|uniref:Uncharacterized protein n=1 Tax=Cylicocyclus nassatus TaxID=53992 RepID=A0AA36HCK5_CYLNA|nr:unnamed protein product [Cylicocyclus nassatus]